jgi:hypothetical protein
MANKKSSEFADFRAKLAASKVEPAKPDTRTERKYFLIVSEGKRTEPLYFKFLAGKLPKNLVDTVNVEGSGTNTLSVIKQAIDLRKKRNQNQELPPYDEVWAVYDKDDFPDKNYHDAIDLADREGIHSAHSNESFELWYILHFEYLQSALKRTDYITKLSKHLGVKYTKNDTKITELIQKHGDLKQATLRAIKLEKLHENTRPAAACPTTKVYILVERLMAHIENRKPKY